VKNGRGAEVHRSRGAEVQSCRATELQSCRAAELQSCRGAEVQRCTGNRHRGIEELRSRAAQVQVMCRGAAKVQRHWCRGTEVLRC
jgi:hypothetical protein